LLAFRFIGKAFEIGNKILFAHFFNTFQLFQVRTPCKFRVCLSGFHVSALSVQQAVKFLCCAVLSIGFFALCEKVQALKIPFGLVRLFRGVVWLGKNPNTNFACSLKLPFVLT
jgi:hypothetical protein